MVAAVLDCLAVVVPDFSFLGFLGLDFGFDFEFDFVEDFDLGFDSCIVVRIQDTADIVGIVDIGFDIDNYTDLEIDCS